MCIAKRTAKKVAKRPTKTSPTKKADPPKRAAAPSLAALGKPEVRKIQDLLASKTSDGVTLGLSLLESLGATQADYQAVLTDAVIRTVLKMEDAATWAAVS